MLLEDLTFARRFFTSINEWIPARVILRSVVQSPRSVRELLWISREAAGSDLLRSAAEKTPGFLWTAVSACKSHQTTVA